MLFKVKYYDQNKGANDSREVEASSPEQACNVVRKAVGGKGISVITCGPVRAKPQAILGRAAST